MTESEKTVLKGLLSAMRAEHEGFHFYSMAARNTEDEKGREVFSQLADVRFVVFTDRKHGVRKLVLI